MNGKLIYCTALVIGTIGCGGRDGARSAAQQQYETVQEGSATGVAATIQGPGETLPAITGTNIDTTSNFALNPTALPPTQQAQPMPAAAYPPPMTSASLPPPPPPPVTTPPPPTPTAAPEPPPAQTDTVATTTTAPEETPKAEEPPPPPPADDATETEEPPPPPPLNVG